MPTHSDAPNPLEILEEYSKTVITLAAAFLALSVTFLENISGSGGDPFGGLHSVSLVIFWVSLILCIGLSINIPGHVSSHIELMRRAEKEPDAGKKTQMAQNAELIHNSAISYARWAYRSLLLAAFVLALIGVLRLFVARHSESAIDAVKTARAYLIEVNGFQSFTVEAVRYEPKDKSYEVIAAGQPGRKIRLLVDSQNRITQANAIP